jgi:hypothetical protein
MPPIFVDGVEINSLYVDGVEQATAFADGVQVYASGPPPIAQVFTAINSTAEACICGFTDGSDRLLVQHLNTLTVLAADLSVVASINAGGSVSTNNNGAGVLALSNGNALLTIETSPGNMYLVEFDSDLNLIQQAEYPNSDPESSGTGGVRTNLFEGSLGRIYIQTRADGFNGSTSNLSMCIAVDSNLDLLGAVALAGVVAVSAISNYGNGFYDAVNDQVILKCFDGSNEDEAWCHVDPVTLAITLQGPMQAGTGLSGRGVALGASFFEGARDDNFIRKFNLLTLAYEGAIDVSIDDPIIFDNLGGSYMEYQGNFLYGMRADNQEIVSPPGTGLVTVGIVSEDMTQWDIIKFDHGSMAQAQGMAFANLAVVQGNLYVSFESPATELDQCIGRVDPNNTSALSAVLDGHDFHCQATKGKTITPGSFNPGGAGPVGVTNNLAHWSRVAPTPSWSPGGGPTFAPVVTLA